MSLYPEDYGSIYYLHNKATHPAKFFGDFFEKRIKAIYDKYAIDAKTDLDTPEYDLVRDELKKVLFVKVAPSFSEFWNGLSINRYQY